MSELDHNDPSQQTIDLNSPNEKPMGFWDHLEELRGVIIKSVVVFIVFATVIGYYLHEFNGMLMWPLHQALKAHPGVNVELGTTSPMEGFNMIIQMCVMGGLACAAPFILYFVGRFVAPALTEKETKAVLPMMASAVVLFLTGAAFGFFLLLPATMNMAIIINTDFELAFRWTVGSYYSMLSWLVLGVGAAFEFPLLIVLLAWLGIVSVAFLKKYRRHAIVVIVILAAIITPTPDPWVCLMFATPLYLLYEVSIIVSSRIEKRRKKFSLFGS